jgi:prepilin-type N-terminal cleavage/methylation domain-containing protein
MHDAEADGVKPRGNHPGQSANAGGFTLVEVLVTIAILGVLLTIAIPGFIGFVDRANETAAQSDLRAAVPAVETFYSDNGTYTGMKIASLRAINAGIKLSYPPADLSKSTYCLKTTVSAITAWKAGPRGGVVSTKPADCTA